MRNNEYGFSATETIVVIVVIGLLGFAGWFVWQRQSDSAPQTSMPDSSTPAPQSEAYQRTTTVPSDWKTYTNNTYKFSIARPADWSVAEGAGLLADTALAADKSLFLLDFRPAGSSDPQYQLQVSRETLEQAVAWRKSIVQDSQAGDSAVKFTITQETRFTYDGHEAIRIDTTADDATSPDSYSSEIYVSANGLLYKFDTSFHDTNALRDQDRVVLTIFESLRIN